MRQWMGRQKKWLVSAAGGIAVVTALGVAIAMAPEGGETRLDRPQSEAACPEGDANCYETGADNELGSGASCPEGDADCYETGSEGGSAAGASCLEGDADCYETGAENAGGESAETLVPANDGGAGSRCAEGNPDCEALAGV